MFNCAGNESTFLCYCDKITFGPGPYYKCYGVWTTLHLGQPEAWFDKICMLTTNLSRMHNYHNLELDILDVLYLFVAVLINVKIMFTSNSFAFYFSSVNT